MSDAFDTEQLAAELRRSGEAWQAFLQVPSLIAGVYLVKADDRETHTPHELDEVYYVVRGRGVLSVRGEDRAVSAGTVMFVPAGCPHHFHRIEEELVLLVFFSKAPGS